MRSIPSIRSLMFALVMLGISAAYAQVGISVTFAPPELPVYEQPLIPGEGYIWTPGYWAWSDDDGDYYWVPGTWVMAPEPGLLWTPLTGDGKVTRMFSMRATGHRRLVSTEGLVTAMVTLALAMKADVGRTVSSTTTSR